MQIKPEILTTLQAVFFQNEKFRKSMDKKRVYQISVKGHLGNRRWDWLDEMSIKVSHCEDFGTITMMTGVVEDQALLHGILYQLYSMGHVLISVNCLAKKEWEVYGLKIVTPPTE